MYKISATLPLKLVHEFDAVLKENGYNSRTKGLQDAIQEYINQHKDQ